MTDSVRPRRSGRPTDLGLTSRLLNAAVGLIAERGLPLTYEVLAARASAGKSAIYRRWPNNAQLVADALSTCRVLPVAPGSENTRDRLVHLLLPLTMTATIPEQAVAAAFGTAIRDDLIAEAVRRVLDHPLAAAVSALTPAAGDLVDPPPAHDGVLRTIRALWLGRLVQGDIALTVEDVTIVVDHILLPQLIAADGVREGRMG